MSTLGDLRLVERCYSLLARLLIRCALCEDHLLEGEMLQLLIV